MTVGIVFAVETFKRTHSGYTHPKEIRPGAIIKRDNR